MKLNFEEYNVTLNCNLSKEEAKNEIKELAIAIGALCEIAGYTRNQLIKNGFTRKEALAICKDFFLMQIASGKEK